MSREEADLKVMTKKASQVVMDHPTHKELDTIELAKALDWHNSQYIH